MDEQQFFKQTIDMMKKLSELNNSLNEAKVEQSKAKEESLNERFSHSSQFSDSKPSCKRHFNSKKRYLPEVFSEDDMNQLKFFRNALEEQIDDDLTLRDTVMFAVNDYISRME